MRLRRLLLAVTLAMLGANRLPGQISPGALAAPHSQLDRNDACTNCHEPGKGPEPRRCLACHRALAQRIAGKTGFHGRQGMERCERCHPEHGGRSFQLVAWGPGGQEAFPHEQTGWPLAGRHRELACRKCHQQAFLEPSVAGATKELDPAKTFLGLRQECAACHKDPHAGTLGSDCSKCHGQVAWKSTSFDHQATKFPLTGAHAKARCDACHRKESPAAQVAVFTQFRGKDLACASCHRDPHGGRLGENCQQCHTSAAFRPAVREAFDHSKTRYPLAGKHRSVACEKCHRQKGTWTVAGFEHCQGCHADEHRGQLATAGQQESCERCHSVEGFVPARFEPDFHSKTRFPLRLAHLAVPCSACHRKVSPKELPQPFAGNVGKATTQFRFASLACEACHRDPHGGTLAAYAGNQGCAACHDEASWKNVRFDHDRSSFPLVGRHRPAPCGRCHRRGQPPQLVLAGTPTACVACHQDVHLGQFVAAGGPVPCQQCHDSNAFRPAANFDHRRTRFPLDGRHRLVPCSGCHPREGGNGKPSTVRYKPLPITCAGCHADAPTGGSR
jgi:hypothetical protein